MAPCFKLRQELADPKLREARAARIDELEHQIFERAAGILDAFISFHEVSPDQADPPADWVAAYGEEGARQRLRVAKSGWAPPSLAPAGAKVAQQFVVGSVRARHYRNQAKLGAGQVVNVKIALPAPTTEAHPGPVTYERKALE